MDWTRFDCIVRGGGRRPGPAGTALQLRIMAENIKGEGSQYLPILTMPLKLRLSPVISEPQRYPFQLLEIGWEVRLADGAATLAFYRSGPLHYGIKTGADTCEEHYSARVALWPNQISRIEQARRGGAASLELWQPWATLKIKEDLICVGLRLNEGIAVRVPQSEWVEKVLQAWGYGDYVLLELDLARGPYSKSLSKASEYLERAQTHFAEGNDEEVLAMIHNAFESIIKKSGGKTPDREAFRKLLKGKLDDDVRDRFADFMHRFCDILHLGRHVSGQPRVRVARREAEFALFTGKSALVYLSKILAIRKTS